MSFDNLAALDPAWIAFAEALPAVVFTARTDGSIEYVNRRWYEYTGVGPEAVLDNAWMSITHPDDLEATIEAWTSGIAGGERAAVRVRSRNGAGEYRWQLSIAYPMLDERGNITRWFGTVTDIHDRVEAEAALRSREEALLDSERRFAVLAETIPVIVWTGDATGWIDWYNRGWYDYTGQTPDEAAGWGWQAAHHPEDFPNVMERWPNSIATGKPFEMEFRLRGSDGKFRWFLTRAQPLRDQHGKIVRWYGSNVLIEEQKKALERTYRVAETLQDVFLPHRLPEVAGIQFDALYVGAERDALVGGDWYDAVELPDGRILFSIGDVTGHGLEASVSVGRLRQAIYATGFDAQGPVEVLERVNRLVRHQGPTIASAIVGYISSDRKRVTYANAGHPPPLVARREVRAVFEPFGGVPLGIVERDLGAQLCTIDLHDVDRIVLYTDGLSEHNRDFAAAEQAMVRAVQDLDTEPMHNPAQIIGNRVLGDQLPADDVALLVISFGEAKPRSTAPVDLVKHWRFHSSDALAARNSREELMKFLRGIADEHADLFTAELVIGEILANTVEHAPGLVEMSIDCIGDNPVVTARDTGPGMTHARSPKLPHDALDENGRGLFLIHELSENVTVRALPGFGTEIRAVLPRLTRGRNGQAEH